MASLVPSQLLLDLYGGAQDAARWRGALDQICQSRGVRSAVVQLFSNDGHRLRQRWAARDSTSLAHAELHDRFINNETNPRYVLRPASSPLRRQIMRDSEIFPAGSRDLALLRQRLAAAGLGESLGVVIRLSDTRTFGLILHRESGDGRDFSEDDEAFLRELAPHLEQASVLMDTLSRTRLERDAFGNALHRLRTGIVLCDRRRHIRWMNAAAEAAIEESDELRIIRGRLCCTAEDEARLLSDLLLRAGDRGQAGREAPPIAIGRLGDCPTQIVAVSLGESADGILGGETGLLGLILCKPGDVPAMSAPDVAQLFGLSPAEARLALALCTGTSVRDYADGRGISSGTARVQLKHALAKTRTNRQSELVRQICSSITALTFHS